LPAASGLLHPHIQRATCNAAIERATGDVQHASPTCSVQRAAHGSQRARAQPCRHYAVDAPGRCLNNMPGTEFRVSPADMEAKLEARRR
jgi:hypothetical protein